MVIILYGKGRRQRLCGCGQNDVRLGKSYPSSSHYAHVIYSSSTQDEHTQLTVNQEVTIAKMRTILSLNRICLRQRPQQTLRTLAHYHRYHTLPARWRIPFRPPPKPPRGTIIVWSLLSPAAFVALSEEDTGDGKTPEEHMLEASRAEIAKELPENIHGLGRAWRRICLTVDALVIEPIATTLRFLHLVIIFVPVIVTIPIVWIGGRQKNRYDERWGTLWWYSFLVRSMERAGPAFIKVHLTRLQALAVG